LIYLLDTNICIYALNRRPLEVLVAQDLILVTNNLREFERIPDLRAESWVS
jgi:predicted nucleic acid-binding protein